MPPAIWLITVAVLGSAVVIFGATYRPVLFVVAAAMLYGLAPGYVAMGIIAFGVVLHIWAGVRFGYV